MKNIEQIIKAEITENPDKYDTAATFNKLQLSYLKIRSDSEQGKYSYVPAWVLSRMVDSNEQNSYLCKRYRWNDHKFGKFTVKERL